MHIPIPGDYIIKKKPMPSSNNMCHSLGPRESDAKGVRVKHV